MKCVALALIHPHGGVLKPENKHLVLEGADSCTIVLAIETNYEMDFQKNFRREWTEKLVKDRISKVKRLSFSEL
jgi:hypothetical protein